MSRNSRGSVWRSAPKPRVPDLRQSANDLLSSGVHAHPWLPHCAKCSAQLHNAQIRLSHTTLVWLYLVVSEIQPCTFVVLFILDVTSIYFIGVFSQESGPPVFYEPVEHRTPPISGSQQLPPTNKIWCYRQPPNPEEFRYEIPSDIWEFWGVAVKTHVVNCRQQEPASRRQCKL